MDNTSLDDFIGTDSEADVDTENEAATNEAVTEETASDESATDEPATEETASDESATDEPATEETETDVEAIEPAVSTYGWTPDGVECAACGGTVERWWHEDGEMVCADCKTW